MLLQAYEIFQALRLLFTWREWADRAQAARTRRALSNTLPLHHGLRRWRVAARVRGRVGARVRGCVNAKGNANADAKANANAAANAWAR